LSKIYFNVGVCVVTYIVLKFLQLSLFGDLVVKTDCIYEAKYLKHSRLREFLRDFLKILITFNWLTGRKEMYEGKVTWTLIRF